MGLLDRIFQYRRTLVMVLAVALPLTVYGAVRAWYSNTNRIADWMPRDFEATRQLGRFVELFGSDELLMISWPECTLDDPRIETFRQTLLQPPIGKPDQEPYFWQVLGGPQAYEFFRDPPLEFSDREALARMRGWMVAPSQQQPDQQQTCLIALVSAAGANDRHSAVGHVFDTAAHVPGLSRDMIHVAGATLEGVAIDQASQSHLLELNLLSFAVCLLVMGLLLRSFRAAVVVFLVALFNELLAMALIYYTGSNMDSVLLLTANLTFVLTVSVGIHLVNYYRDTLEATTADDAPLGALRVALKPTLLATLTTALGLVSLTASEVKPLLKFGGYSAAAIVVAAGISMVYLTLHFLIWPLAKGPAPSQREPATEPRQLAGLRFLELSRWPLLVGVVVVFVGGISGVQRLRTSVGLTELLKDDSRVIRDYQWLEENIGPLIPVEIVLSLPSGDIPVVIEQLRVVFQLHAALTEIDRSQVVISAANLCRSPPAPGRGMRRVAEATVYRRQITNNLPQIRESGYLRTDEQCHYWRLTVRVPATRETGFGPLLQQIEETVERTMSRADVVPAGDVMICGGVPLVYQVQEQLLRDLIKSFLLAFLLVGLTLVLLFRSLACGLICMIPNVLPSALVFGVMGWLGTPVEIGGILTASAALGIAVDDSLHFITWFRRKIAAGGTIPEAVWHAYRRCGLAMVQTTLICSLGLVVFAASPFLPMVRFGWCMFWLLTVALIADLVVLPAILLSPLGRPFLPRERRPSASLREFAVRVAGPRDAVINIAINTPIAVWVYGGLDYVPLVGLPSLLVICGPMSFLLPLLTTFFGTMNGVMQRAYGRLPPAWPPGHRWARSALLRGLILGLVTCTVCVTAALSVNRLWPGIVLPKWVAVISISLLAGLMGFFFHAAAVSRTSRLGRETSLEHHGRPENETSGADTR